MKQILKDGVDATIQAMMIEDLQVCDLYPPGFVYPADEHSQARLTDANAETEMLDAIKHFLFGCRRNHLDAFRRGFQGIDQEGVDMYNGSCYDFQKHTSMFSSSEFAEMMRGRSATVAELLNLLRFKRPQEVPQVVKATPVDEAVEQQMRTWFKEIVSGFDEEEVRIFMLMSTSRPTLSAARHGDPERDAIVIVIHVDDQPPAGSWEGTPLTGGTCARILYVPWVHGYSKQSLHTNVRRTFDEFVREEKELGGAAVDYS